MGPRLLLKWKHKQPKLHPTTTSPQLLPPATTVQRVRAKLPQPRVSSSGTLVPSQPRCVHIFLTPSLFYEALWVLGCCQSGNTNNQSCTPRLLLPPPLPSPLSPPPTHRWTVKLRAARCVHLPTRCNAPTPSPLSMLCAGPVALTNPTMPT